eukprot:CAMPEP_0184498660 /NCGR_PEP_ID=MMETSP0113_2-20130426/39505_1 /TAXON_ID=91329 /ORGANISM="Norrisiella sphaerica, Strain BC52" /LENGTH=4666 /DNA_ID=CAMNT_0026886275 /DNA_START=34 /DNA_END=14034 /DNA_ORIENTATION=-
MSADKCIEYIKARLHNSLNPKGAKNQKFEEALTEEGPAREAIEEFCGGGNKRLLVATLGRGDVPEVTNELPETFRRKLIYFLKPPEIDPNNKLDISDLRNKVLCAELTDNLLENLKGLMNEIVCPLVRTPKNREGWPSVSTKEVMLHLDKYMSSLHVAVGQSAGRTLLPPPVPQAYDENIPEAERVHHLQSVVIEWSQLISDITSKTPEMLHEKGNPTPLEEIKFWKEKAADLENVQKQLQSEQTQGVIKILSEKKSPYIKDFKELETKVGTSIAEARENLQFLKALEKYFKEISNCMEFDETPLLFPPLLHLMILVWKTSKTYNTKKRLLNLMQEVSNLVIEKASAHCAGQEIWKHVENEDTKEAKKLLQQAVDICKKLKVSFAEYQKIASQELPENGEAWDVDANDVFIRLNTFIERCKDVDEFLSVHLCFDKLQPGRIVFGSSKGLELTEHLEKVYAKFTKSAKEFQDVKYDVIDIDADEFDDDFFAFRMKIRQLERTLGAMLIDGYEDITTILARYDLLEAFGDIIQRPLIKDALEKKQHTLLKEYRDELISVQARFLEERDNPCLDVNKSPLAGVLQWCKGLMGRIEVAENSIDRYTMDTKNGDLAKEVVQLHETVIKMMKDFMNEKIEAWKGEVKGSSQTKLDLPLLTREEDTRKLNVNFDPSLVRLLQEVRYMHLLHLDVPDYAEVIYEQHEKYREFTGKLELVKNMYNEMITTLHPVEYPLIAEEVKNMDGLLEDGIASINWNSDVAREFIDKNLKKTTEIYQRVTLMHDNFKKIMDKLESFALVPLFERKAKTITAYAQGELLKTIATEKDKGRLIDLDGKQREFAKLLASTCKSLEVDKGSDIWKNYLIYVEESIEKYLAKNIVVSTQALLDQFDEKKLAKGEVMPLVTVKLELEGKEVELNALSDEKKVDPDDIDAKDIFKIVLDWAKDFFHVGSVMKKFSDGKDYLDRLKDNKTEIELFLDKKRGTIKTSVDQQMKTLQAVLDRTQASTSQLRKQFEDFEALWATSLEDEFQSFMELLEQKKEKWMKANEGKSMSPMTESEIELKEFEKKIVKYRKFRTEVESMDSPVEIGWLKINCDPIKNTLEEWVTKRINNFTSYLFNEVTFKLNTVEMQMIEVNKGLKEVSPDSPNVSQELKDVLGYIQTVRTREKEVKNMFEPMRATVKLLTKYGRPFSEEENKSLTDAPQKWEATCKKVDKVSESIQKLQTAEVEKIKARVREYFDTVLSVRRDFQNQDAFNFGAGIEAAYKSMEEQYNKLNEVENRIDNLTAEELLFECENKSASYKKKVELCRHENKNLKIIWDFASLVHWMFTEWEKTLWNDIDAEKLGEECKKLQKQFRKYKKQCGQYKAYLGLDDKIKNMMVILPLISDLHSESMKDRHWDRLMKETKKHFVMGPKFCLKDMIDLDLHKFQDTVGDIVDEADKQAKIQVQLARIKTTWADMKLEFQEHKSGVMMLQPSEDLTIALEENMASLQTMQAQGKNVEFFRKDVDYWTDCLRTVETVFNDWVEVQTNWGSLETIFIGSEDIRKQLPQDAARFEGIDSKFRALMQEVVKTPKVTDALNDKKRLRLLDEMKTGLEQCEKSLFAYLEVKRMFFPRFYFVSNAALLDILSNGGNPQAIQKHLGDCFNNVIRLQFKKEEKALSTPELKDLESMLKKNGDIWCTQWKKGTGEAEKLAEKYCNGQSEEKKKEWFNKLYEEWKAAPFTKFATGMYSSAGKEYIEFHEPYECKGAVEAWLRNLVKHHNETMIRKLGVAKFEADHWHEKPRHKWLFDFSAQNALTASFTVWTEEVEAQFEALAEGNETALKDYLKVYDERLSHLIDLVLGRLNKRDRVKVITLITIDVHSRDVVQMLIDRKVADAEAFDWQCQMRYYWDKEKRVCDTKIMDSTFHNSFEYIGNTGRLVITPLTDRCYITLSQALTLKMGGAPAGPAGTGKTETVKDLGRGVGIPVYVFNCSEQMNVESMSAIYKGLSQVGAWGCFDEFNRIRIEVLSVVATQVTCVLNALKTNAKEFDMMGDSLKMVPTVGMFITMNPGYAGRTELPENLKALFRPCAMVVPDTRLICENMLMSEGFRGARVLAYKFTTLYNLSKELLSQQRFYDWGLRATKAVLRVAGGLKREAPPGTEEDVVLMRALRDFNLPKLVQEDKDIFRQLCSDLFPGRSNVARIMDQDLVNATKEACIKMKLQPEAGFMDKVVEMQELFNIRHSVFIIGPASAGKTKIWNCLAEANKILNNNVVFMPLNPKAVRNNDLYGYLTKTEWHDGILSTIMRDMARNNPPYKAEQNVKWIVLDGDVDAEWIESLNTVMDDNKVLTLVSNERIPLSDAMRLLFEVANLNHATPATVSRAGILYVNPGDVGPKPFLDSWLAQQNFAPTGKRDDKLKSHLSALFNKYASFEDMYEIRKETDPVVPVGQITKMKSLCYLMEGILDEMNVTFLKGMNKNQLEEAGTILHSDAAATYLEAAFAYAAAWALGGMNINEKNNDSRRRFNSWWKVKHKKDVEYKALDAKKGFDVFSFFPDEKGEMKMWESVVPDYKAGANANLVTQVFVPTDETLRVTRILDLISKTAYTPTGMPNRPGREQCWGVMLVGGAGTGKTAIIENYLRNETDEQTVFKTINLNFYTDAVALKDILESAITKRQGRTFGPPVPKKLIYYVDDINMQKVDTYDTQSTSELIRQHMDYGVWYDTKALDQKTIVDTQYLSSMNPKAGSFTINPRLQSHFTTVGCMMPTKDTLNGIFSQVMTSHMQDFKDEVKAMTPRLVDACIDIHSRVADKFLPSSVKFHYLFNMRELGKLFQGLCRSEKTKSTRTSMMYLFQHECMRVYHDRLLSRDDVQLFIKEVETMKGKHFVDEVRLAREEAKAEEEKAAAAAGGEEKKKDKKKGDEPVIFTTFEKAGGLYQKSDSMSKLRVVLDGKLEEYNEENATMDLVLFGMAMEHVTRICRIVEQDRGNALLVGVGGSGKQSLSRLAAKGICGYEVFQIKVTQTYRESDLKTDLQTLYKKTGEKNQQVAFLLTDAQIVDDKWLVYINDTLSSGYVPDLFAPEDLEGICGGLRSAAKAEGIPDNPTALMDFFISRVRRNLHIILCFSPVGDVMRQRCRKFPGLINCTEIDWFHPWPREALKSVSERFISTMPAFESKPALLPKVSSHMAEVHLAVENASEQYLRAEKRYFYTTPKSFLELIAFYKSLFEKSKTKLDKSIERLEKGIAVLANTGAKVAELQDDLKRTMVIVEEKKVAAAAAIKDANEKKSVVEREQAIADKEAAKASVIEQEANDFKNKCQDDLDKVQPILDAATKAVDCLEVKQIQTFKSFTNPPSGTPLVTDSVAILLGKDGKGWSPGWKSGKKLLSNPSALIEELKAFDGRVIPEDRVTKADKIISQEVFTVEIMMGKSEAAANLCGWVCNIVRFYKVYKDVAPKMKALEEAQARAKAAADQVAALNAKVAQLQAALDAAIKSKEAAEDEKAKVEADAKKCQDKLFTADRLVGGLAGEKIRWGESVKQFKAQAETMIGDVMLSAAFVSYIGAFNAEFRMKLWKHTWMKDLEKKQIPIRENLDPLRMLSNESMFAQWQNEGLAADRNSFENAAILCQCKRWPLLIDPQLQGSKWIENHYPDMKKITMNTKNWMRTVKEGVQFGYTVYLHSILENLDASLDPVVAQQIVRGRGGKGAQINLGELVDYDMNFKLVIQTKLPNPHYKPEIAAQTTLINFMVTESGLEDQLLALVVNKERPDLEEKKAALVRAINEYNIELAALEDKLLAMLNEADPNTILDNIELIDGLELTKSKSVEVNQKVSEAKEAEIQINEARNKYRAVAQEASWIYFLLMQLWTVDHMYQYSLAAFTTFFFKAIDRADKPKDPNDVKFRVAALKKTIRITIFRWVNRGTFSRHKMILVAQLLFKLMRKRSPDLKVDFNKTYFKFLLQGTKKFGEEKPPTLNWLPDASWASLCALAELKGFDSLATDVVASPNRFKEWYNKPRPEVLPLPSNWRKLIQQNFFMHMLVVRAIRPDRLTASMNIYAERTLPDGKNYTQCDAGVSFTEILKRSLDDSATTTPIFFILSPGADPVVNLQDIGSKNGYFPKKWHRVALGEGQDVVAMRKLAIGVKEGHWVILENIHLMPSWTGELEKALNDYTSEGAYHPDFRLFLSAEPSNKIPIGLLERSIKLTNEPPQGLTQNLKRAFATFEKEEFEYKDGKVKMILFALCHFHAVIIERCKFGPKGWNRSYPFNTGDLENSGQVLSNYLERGSGGDKIPWSDLRYIFGEILYGGHITDDWDRRLNMTYMRFYFRAELLDGMELFPFSESYPDEKFPSPEPLPYDEYFTYIDEYLKVESPVAYGMHPNAEIAVRTLEGENLFKVVQELQPRGSDDSDESGGQEAKEEENPVRALLNAILERVKPIQFDTEDIATRIGSEERGPYQNVFLQECDRMNVLRNEIKDSLEELELGMKGELQMSDRMEELAQSLELNRVPSGWVAKAYPSLRKLAEWLDNLMERAEQLQKWTDEPTAIPVVTDLSLCFNPQSFLTSIMQVTAQTQQKELDKLTIMTDVTRKQPEELEVAVRDGAYVTGLWLEAARWDSKQSCLEECLPRVLFDRMPVIVCRAILRDKLEKNGVYTCPCYKTTDRGPTYVFDATLRTKAPADKWILSGVVMLLEVPMA